jgi:phosphoglycolate phosphatase
MGKRFDLLVFDWDGTVVDSAGHIVDALQCACTDLALSVPSNERARYIIGLGLRDAMEYLFPEMSADNYSRLVERYRHHYLAGDHRVVPFPGVTDGIARLHQSGFLLAVATGKSRAGLDRAFVETGLGQFFHSSRCADESFSKPHPEMLRVLMKMLSVAPERTLMIGDTTHDLLMAANAGVLAVAVSYGAHPLEQLQNMKPLECVASSEELLAWLQRHA